MQFVGHTEDGYGLSWNPKQERVLSPSATIRWFWWNIKDGFSKANALKYPSERTLTHRSAAVNDVEFHPRDSNVLGIRLMHKRRYLDSILSIKLCSISISFLRDFHHHPSPSPLHEGGGQAAYPWVLNMLE
jgi:hypothetical protein